MIIQDKILLFLLVFLVSFIVTYIAIPSIIRVANLKNLFDNPEEKRRIHTTKIPNLGGVAIFAGIIISVLFFIDLTIFPEIKYIIIGVVILFFIGIKDDILMIAPATKFLGQIIVSFIVVYFGGISITDLHGFFGIFDIHKLIGIPLSMFTIIVIINAINFIDGIDGLSATVSIIITATFGLWFYLVKDCQYVIISLAIIGALAAFLRFNLFSTKKKIFMGDTGSLIVGLLISILVIQFNEKNLLLSNEDIFFILPSPSVSFGVLIVPLFDMLRVIFIRIIKKQFIFAADQNHIHHVLLKLGLNHRQIVLIIAATNLFFIILSFWLSDYFSIRRLLLIQLILISFITFIPTTLLRRKNRGKKSKKEKNKI